MSDASGSTSWRYDSRGRRYYEKKTITNAGEFLTQWGFNSADMVTWRQYPGGNGGQAGEQVNFGYLYDTRSGERVHSGSWALKSTVTGNSTLELLTG